MRNSSYLTNCHSGHAMLSLNVCRRGTSSNSERDKRLYKDVNNLKLSSSISSQTFTKAQLVNTLVRAKSYLVMGMLKVLAGQRILGMCCCSRYVLNMEKGE